MRFEACRPYIVNTRKHGLSTLGDSHSELRKRVYSPRVDSPASVCSKAKRTSEGNASVQNNQGRAKGESSLIACSIRKHRGLPAGFHAYLGNMPVEATHAVPLCRHRDRPVFKTTEWRGLLSPTHGRRQKQRLAGTICDRALARTRATGRRQETTRERLTHGMAWPQNTTRRDQAECLSGTAGSVMFS